MKKCFWPFQIPSYTIFICMNIDDSVNGKCMEVDVICY